MPKHYSKGNSSQCSSGRNAYHRYAIKRVTVEMVGPITLEGNQAHRYKFLGVRGCCPLGINYKGAKYVWAPSDFICFICSNIKICRLSNVEKYAFIRPQVLCFVLSINKKVIDDFFNFAKRCVSTL